MLKRYYDNLDNYIKNNKVLVLYGPRRVGKTTLLKKYLNNSNLKIKFDSGDNIKVQQILSSSDFDSISDYINGVELLAIDEAQNIPEIGKGLKILVDNFPGLKIIATGSSSFEISQKIGEPLTGRKTTLILYPLSQFELADKYSKYELKNNIGNFLIYGLYPEILTVDSLTEKINLLLEIVNSYLLKDILSFDRIKNSKSIYELLRLLAFQVGSQVSENELAVKLKINVKTVGRYLDLLEKTFVIFRLGSFSRNLRNEISHKSKYYFYDTGIRNGLIENFNRLELRNDAGQLWENFIISERIKYKEYKNIYGKLFFRRTYEKKEIDLIEDKDGTLSAFEIKWGETGVRDPKEFLMQYPDSKFKLINRKNYLDFISE